MTGAASAVQAQSAQDPARREAQVSRRRRQSTARHLLPGHRVATCGFRPAPGLKAVSFVRSAAGEVRADGCHACGSIWTCPTCASRITEVRGQDLQAGTAAWLAEGNSVAMLTLTAPHKAGEPLVDLWQRLKDAMTALRESRTWKREVLARTVGVVRAAEVLHGDNGWHPHWHVLIFWKGKVSDAARSAVELEISAAWQAAAQRAGLPQPHPVIGCSLVIGETCQERLAAYLAKWGKAPTEQERADLQARQWGAERELTKWHTKKSRGGLTPFQMLDLYSTARSSVDRQRLRILFLEFASAMRGQRQLVWSRGLKSHLQALGATFDDQDDDAVSNAPAEGEQAVASCSAEEWRWIVNFKMAGLLLDTLQRLPHQSTITPFLHEVRDRRAALFRQRHMRDPEWSFDYSAQAV